MTSGGTILGRPQLTPMLNH